MQQTLPQTRDLVLIGGGHTHALVLRMWAMDPLPGAALTVIDPGPSVAYSGMLPGFVAGHYTRDDLDIDLVRLARAAGARLILDRAVAIDRTAKIVKLQGGREIAYDIASLDIGIHSRMPDLPGFRDHAVAAKPLGPFARAWSEMRARPGPVAVIGGGLAGVELAMAMAHDLRARGHGDPVHLIDRGRVVDGMPARAALLAALRAQQVTIHEQAQVVRLTQDAVVLADGTRIDAQFVTGAAGARPYAWLSQTGLRLHDGFVHVGCHLQSSDDAIFAAGDCAHLSHAPRPKAGVYAVRAAPILAYNLRVRLQEAGKMRDFHPQRDYLKLVSLGGRRALAEKGGRVLQGRLMWRWKDRIDRSFMRRFTQIAPMTAPALPRHRAAGVEDALGGKPMCGGCGAKVGQGALHRALQHLPPPTRADVVALPGDDAALLRTGGVRQVLTTDHLRAVTDDPAVMARIAATHALGDIWAMGAQPQAAVAQITLPRLSAPLQERRMTEILTAAEQVLSEAGAALVGGHSAMGDTLSIGFSITGLCERDPITLAGGRPGDALILTKPIGSGTILAAEMVGQARGADVAACWDWMQQGQAKAAVALAEAHAMTDVTGFGLAGHLWNICSASECGATLHVADLPVMAGARDLAEAGVRSSLWPDNRAAVPLIDGAADPLLFDPQTSGGLLAAVADGPAALAALRDQGVYGVQIGTLNDGPPRITLRE